VLGVGLRRWTAGLLGLAVGVYAWFASGLQPFTLPSLVTVVGGGVVAMVVGSRLPHVRHSTSVPAVGGAWPWLALTAALAAWELQSFVQHPRHDHPTLSSLSNTALASHGPRAVALLAWLAGAAWLARR